jgi:eukaryotic-like serine/threonine-protein kinase
MAQPRYQVLERIDAGGMAEVFKANSTSLQGFQKLVAIKRVLPSLTKNERFIRMFLDEAKVSLHLSHTNCVQVFDLGIAEGAYFIVMEFVDGTNLKNIIEELRKRNAQLSVEQVVFITIEICRGLAHAHNKRDHEGRPLDIVHRDISPPNVLVSREGEVKITDFGLAKAKNQVETTDPGVVKGKFGYLSPEAAQGETVDSKTDIFAVGILIWEMLAGKRLFLGKTDYDTLKLVQGAQVQSITDLRADVPHQLDYIIMRALARDPRQRYQTVREMGQELANFLYEYGRPVTAFDIADQVELALKSRSGAKVELDTRVNEMIQREINHLVSLEQVDDLDLYLAQNYASTSEAPSTHEPSQSGLFEDPRLWADFGASDGPAPAFLKNDPNATADAWQAASVGKLMSPETAHQAAQTAANNSSGSPKLRSVSGPQRPVQPATPPQQSAPPAQPPGRPMPPPVAQQPPQQQPIQHAPPPQQPMQHAPPPQQQYAPQPMIQPQSTFVRADNTDELPAHDGVAVADAGGGVPKALIAGLLLVLLIIIAALAKLMMG